MHASLQVLEAVEDGKWFLPLDMSGIQLVLVSIEGDQIDINWNALDFELG
jgi:hypothetical protein